MILKSYFLSFDILYECIYFPNNDELSINYSQEKFFLKKISSENLWWQTYPLSLLESSLNFSSLEKFHKKIQTIELLS